VCICWSQKTLIFIEMHGTTTKIIETGTSGFTVFLVTFSIFAYRKDLWCLYLQSMKHHETETFQVHLTWVSNVSLKKTAMNTFRLAQRTQWTGIIYSHNQHVTHNKIHMINMWLWIKCNHLHIVQGVRKRLYPFFSFFFFLGAQCVESGVSCTDCY
jgi:hypothetical protein